MAGEQPKEAQNLLDNADIPTSLYTYSDGIEEMDGEPGDAMDEPC